MEKIRPLRVFNDEKGYYIKIGNKKQYIKIPSINLKKAQQYVIRNNFRAKVKPKRRRTRQLTRINYKDPSIKTRILRVEENIPLSNQERVLLEELKKEKKEREQHETQKEHKAALKILEDREEQIRQMSQRLLMPSTPLEQVEQEESRQSSEEKLQEEEEDPQVKRLKQTEEKLLASQDLDIAEESIEDLKRQRSDLKKNKKIAATADEREAIQKQINGLNYKLKKSSKSQKTAKERLQKGSSSSTSGGRALWSDEIDEYFKDNPEYGGTIAGDQIVELDTSELPIGSVVNLDRSDQPGTHWCALYIGPDSVEWYDPSGNDPPAYIDKQIRDIVKQSPVLLKYKINRIAGQKNNTSSCGYFCIRFLDSRFAGKDFLESTSFSDKILNDKEAGEETIKKEFALI